MDFFRKQGQHRAAQSEEPSRRGKSFAQGDVASQPVRRKATRSNTTVALPFSRRLASAGLPDLIYKYRDPRDLVINLATLQRMNLLGIQQDLIHEVARIDDRQEVPADHRHRIKILLSDYASALRDFEMSVDYSAKADGDMQDPFILTTGRSLERSLMDNAGLLTDAGRLDRPIDLDQAELPRAARRPFNKARTAKSFLERFRMAIFGGMSLIAPMLIMVLHKDLLTTLLTASTSVLLFGFAVAAFSSESPETVLGVVAAYAAVLVVFVGANS